MQGGLLHGQFSGRSSPLLPALGQAPEPGLQRGTCLLVTRAVSAHTQATPLVSGSTPTSAKAGAPRAPPAVILLLLILFMHHGPPPIHRQELLEAPGTDSKEIVVIV